jgi:chromosome segregation ATPase
MKFLNRFKRKNQSDLPPEAGAEPAPTKEMPAAVANGTEMTKAPAADEICLRLGDFLHRIPAHLLQAGPHDLQKELRFGIHSLSERIKRGETTISLIEIYRQLPEIFRSEVRDGDKQQVLYPWRKVISMIKVARPEESGAADAVAENLAEKIRQKKPGARASAAAGSATAAQTPILRGRGKQQASWFSRTTLEKGAENPTAEPSAGPQAVATQPSTNLLETPVQGTEPASDTGASVGAGSESLVLPAGGDGSASEIALKLVSENPDSNSAKEEPRPSVAPVEAVKFPVRASTAPERAAESEAALAGLPADLQRRVAMIKGDYERQLAELELARKTYAAEVERLQDQLNQTADRLDEERTANSVSRELLQQAARDRDATQQQIADLQQKMAALQKDSRLSEVTAERDALLQQKAHLSSQISELSKRGASAMPRAGDNSGASAVLQRQVEEFQRRIALMEAAQRDTALELAREKEARAKAEKLLTAAEKLQEQSANYMETAKAEIRKEVEASVKPREIEARKLQKELQDQITQLTDQNRKLATELENARAALSAPAAEASPAADIQSQAIAQLEEDIENYRERLKALIKERDSARAEAKQAAENASAEKGNDVAAVRTKHEEELQTLRSQLAEQSGALESLRNQHLASDATLATERAALQSRLEAVQKALEDAQQAHASQIAQLEKAAEDRLQANSQSESVAMAELRQKLAEAVDGLKAASDESTELRKRCDELSAKRAELAAELEGERASRDERMANAEREHSSIVREREELSQRMADTERALHAAEEERNRLTKTNDGLLGDPALIEAIAGLRSQVRTLEQQRAEATSRADATAEQAAAIADELNRARAARDAAEVKLSAERDDAQRKEAKLEADFAEERQRLGAQRAAELADREEMTKRLADERDQAIRSRAAALQDLETARLKQDELVASLEEERRKAAALQELDRQLLAEREKFAGQRAELENQIAASARTATQVVEQSAAELAESRAGIESLKQALNEAQERARVLEAQRSESHAEQDRMNSRISELDSAAQRSSAQVEQLRTRLESAEQDAAAALLNATHRQEEELSRMRRELALLKTERDNLAQQRDELLRRLNRITDEHKRLFDDLSATPQIMQAPAPAEEREPANVIEVTIPEVLPPEPANGIAIPRARAVAVPPPKLHTL